MSYPSRHRHTWDSRGFVQTAVTLTTSSLVAPFLSGGDTATIATLLVLHLVAAASVIPAVTPRLRVVG